MQAIADYLGLPQNCLTVTSMVVGWPAEAPPQRDRLPTHAWIHDETYRCPSPADIEAQFGERDRRGRERYLGMPGPQGDELRRRWDEHGIASLAQFYTSKIKYDPDTFARDSASLRALMEARGFLQVGGA
jgi:hypothetical protein